MNKRAQTDFLFAQPSFLSGAARVFDLGGTFDVYNEQGDADTAALRSDWYAIGDDMRQAMNAIPVEFDKASTL